jgi:hypothetical protein
MKWKLKGDIAMTYMKVAGDMAKKVEEKIKQSKHKGAFRQYAGWIEIAGFRLFMRLTKHYIEGAYVSTIDLANFEIAEKIRGKGIFTCFLRAVEDMVDKFDMVILVESILNKRLMPFLRLRGYTEVVDKYGIVICPNYIRRPKVDIEQEPVKVAG